MILKKTLISLLILFALTQSQSLPGLDYLKSGYDGTKILNDQLGKSKQSIFDFNNSMGESSFSFNGNTYKIPMVVQATAVSVRKESQSKQIITTYPEFLRKYAESISFSSGFGVSDISVDLAFNSQLEELQKLMSQEGKAIAVSQSSWALYGLTTAPAFMMPLNANFSQALDSLNKNAKTPSNETQQSSYNDLITQFGTHYISSAVIGGSAKVFTAFNKTYIEKTDYTKVTTELTLNYKSLQFEFTYGKNTTNTTEVPSDDFRNNTKSYLAFSPEVDSMDEKSKPWAVWESKVPSAPQPLNTTVAYISDLVFQYPEVSQHLRKTIEFYLKNARLPSYSDLSKGKVYLQQKQEASSLPGLDYLQSGYDGTKILNDQLGKSKQSIFDFNNSMGESSFSFNGNTYKVPMVVQATAVSVRKESQSKQIITTYPEFLRKYAESISFSSGFGVNNISVDLEFNSQLEELQKLMSQEGKAIAVSQSSWALYGLTTAPAFMMPLNANFSQALDSLNKNAKTPSSEAQQSSYNDLITQFGTHYISSAVIGGSAKVFTAFNKTYLEKTDYTKVTTELTLNYKSLQFEFTYGKNTTNTTEVPSDDFRNNTKSYLAFSPEVDSMDEKSKPWAVWESKVPSTPQPLNTTVAYISDLVFQYPEVSQHLRKTIEFYLKNARLPSFSELSKGKVYMQSKLRNPQAPRDEQISFFQWIMNLLF